MAEGLYEEGLAALRTAQRLFEVAFRRAEEGSGLKLEAGLKCDAIEKMLEDEE